MNWKLAEAKNRLSEVVTRVFEEGPQYITRRKDEVVMISKKEYEELKGEEPNFVEFILNGPSFEGVDLERDRRPDTREIPDFSE